jgi:ribosome biogenesis GTPase
MARELSVLVGQSGVGKSSLTNALLGAHAREIGTLTGKGKQGRHTTTTASLLRLPGRGELIDSPGVRSYAPFIPDARRIASGFREFRQYADRCKFADCSHRAEPGCRVKAAVAAGTISAQRYESYVKLRATLESLA